MNIFISLMYFTLCLFLILIGLSYAIYIETYIGLSIVFVGALQFVIFLKNLKEW
jgi:hypothetical protein